MLLGGRMGGGVGGLIWFLLIICYVLFEMFCLCFCEGVFCVFEKIYWQFYKDVELWKFSCQLFYRIMILVSVVLVFKYLVSLFVFDIEFNFFF